MQTLRSKHLIAKLFCLLFALILCAPQFIAVAQTGTQTQPARPVFPPRQYIPNRNYDTQHIKLDLHFDWEREQALGTATITFAPLTTNLQSVEFDAANMTFSSVKLASGTPLKYEADAAKEKLRITMDRAYQPSDVVTVVISYNTNGVSKVPGLAGGQFGRGLTFIKPRVEDPTRPKQIWSQGETEYNHYWFPCYDHPNDFATTEMVATVEKPMMVVSNGRLIETKNNKDGTRTFHWKMEQPHASYLTSIVVGEYAPVEGSYAGIPVITYVYPNEVAEGKVTAARLPDMVKFFSEKTGLKYPYAKYAQTVTRDFGGGMENISATTQTDSMIHDARTTLDRDQDGLQSHELAHQWFGDYVTCRAWSDIWLNESFATYFQAMWDEHRLGRDDFLYRDVKNNQDAYFGSWTRGIRRPIVTGNYADKDAIFDNYAYPRGGAVLHMLRKTLGEENWWRSINHYLTKYAHQPVQTEQFRIAIEETTGQPMDWFFEQWLYKMGHPVFNVTQSYNPAAKTLTLKVRQEQKPDPNSDYPQVEFFRTPLEIEIGTNATTHVERVLVEPKEEQTFTFAVDSQPTLVNFDYGSTLIKELKFEKPTDELIYQLTRDEDVTGRLWALGQLKTRINEKEIAAADRQRIAAALGAALNNDKFWGVRVDVAAAVGGLNDTEIRTALLAATKDKDAHVRSNAVNALAKSKDAALANVYLPLLNDQSYTTIRSAALALGDTKNAAAYDALVKMLDVPSWRDQIRASALLGLANLGDKRALELGNRYVAAGNLPTIRAAAITLLASVGKDDPRTFQIISDALSYGASTLNFPMSNAAGEALVKLGDPRGVDVIEQAIKKANNPQMQGFIRQFQQRLRQSTTKSGGQ
ncbi:MAG: aminopeptidase [Acidobacteriota bacterium]|jgi:aminopeptidase N|nr:aminopeptidase [Acidobacteriota bacterium]